MVWSPLQAGLLTGKPGATRRSRPSPASTVGVPDTVDFDRLYRIVDVLETMRERGATIPQVAIDWVLHKPGVDTVILGARDEAQLRDILKAADFRLTPEESARLDEVSAPLRAPYRSGTSTSSASAGTRVCRRSAADAAEHHLAKRTPPVWSTSLRRRHAPAIALNTGTQIALSE